MSWQPDRKTSATPPSRTTATDQNLAQPASRHHAVGDRPTNENNEPCCKQLKQRLCSLSCGRLWKSTRVDRTEVKAKDCSFSFPSRPLQEFGQSDSVDIQVFHTRPAVQVTIFRFGMWNLGCGMVGNSDLIQSPKAIALRPAITHPEPPRARAPWVHLGSKKRYTKALKH